MKKIQPNNSKCHPNRFVWAKGLCKNCYDKHLKSMNEGYRIRQLTNASEWSKRNPEKKLVTYLKRREKERSNPLIRRQRDLRKKYGLSLDDYATLLEGQNGRCKLCFRERGLKPLHVDHCHKTNKVRGLLCHQCNWYLGVVERDLNILRRIESYLNQ
jgi:hypothetical protein